MLSSLLKWLGEEDTEHEHVTSAPSAGRPEMHAPAHVIGDDTVGGRQSIDLFNEHIAGIQVSLAENNVQEACELLNALQAHLSATDEGAAGIGAQAAVSSDGVTLDPRWEMVNHLKRQVTGQLFREACRNRDPDFVVQMWSWAATITGPESLPSQYAHDFKNQLDTAIRALADESVGRMSAIRKLLTVDSADSLSKHTALPSWMRHGENIHPFYSHHVRVLRKMYNLSANVAAREKAVVPLPDARDALFARTTDEDEFQQPHIECLTHLLGEVSKLLAFVVQHESPIMKAVGECVHGTTSAAALLAVQAYRDDHLMTITSKVGQAMLDHAYVYDQTIIKARKLASNTSAYTAFVGNDILQDLVEIHMTSPKTRQPIGSPEIPPFEIQLDLALCIVDEAADETSFLCQVLERYLRFVCASLSISTMLQPSRLNDTLSQQLHIFQSDYVLLERAYIVTLARHAIFSQSGWVIASVHEDPSIITFSWCDQVFFLLSKAISRSMATCADMVAAGAINYVAICIEDTVLPGVDECIHRGNNPLESSKDPVRADGAACGTDELEAALLSRVNASLFAEDRKRINHQEVAEDMNVGLRDAIAAVNTVATACKFADTLISRAQEESAAAFPERGSAIDAMRLLVPFQELKRVIDLLQTKYLACLHAFVSNFFRDLFSSFGAAIRTVRYNLASAQLDPALAVDQLPNIVRSHMQAPRTKALLPQLLQHACRDGVVLAVAQVLAQCMEATWLNVASNEFGALLMKQQLLQIQQSFEQVADAPLRHVFRKLHQISEVVATESVSELYSLVFPVPTLCQQEVALLVSHHASMSAVNAAQIRWDKVPVVPS